MMKTDNIEAGPENSNADYFLLRTSYFFFRTP
jgi:hypothetical protein